MGPDRLSIYMPPSEKTLYKVDARSVWNKMDRDFFTTVLSRMRKPSGLPVSDMTVDKYTRLLHTLNRRGDLQNLADPRKLYEILSGRHENAQTILSALRPAQMLLGNMTQSERDAHGLADIDVMETLQEYSLLLKELTAKRKIDRTSVQTVT